MGAPRVARRMREIDATFGGEENGGLIFPRHQYTRDGALGLAFLLEILASGKEALSAHLERIPTYHLVKGSVPFPVAQRDRVMDALAGHLGDREVDRTDGLKVFYDAGWVLVRPSGTEPIIRVFAEATTPKDARRLFGDVMALLEESKPEA
ncbi:MAG: hypothetical protein R3291_05200 [Thermoplasmata archaeon]|nr:hypothetical protein [Thermoplasmata archaeon]